MVGIFTHHFLFLQAQNPLKTDFMNSLDTSCFRFGDGYRCPVCQCNDLVKNGNTPNGKRCYQCKHCHKRFITNYAYKAYLPDTNPRIIQLTKEGLGIRSTARVLAISVTTLLKRISLIANPPAFITNKQLFFQF